MITLSSPFLGKLFFVMIRLGTTLVFTPITAIKQLPVHLRLLLIFSLSLFLVQDLPNPKMLDNNTLFLGSLAEGAKGLILATSLYATVAVFQIAGQLIDDQMGLNAMSVFNPTEHSQESLSSRLLSMLAVLFFFKMDGHVWLLKGLAYSFVISPPGSLNLFLSFTPIIKQFGFMFSLAFMIASPLILVLLLIEFSAGILTRNMPQMNTWFLALPFKIMVGLVLLSMMMDNLVAQSNLVFERCFQTWKEVLS